MFHKKKTLKSRLQRTYRHAVLLLFPHRHNQYQPYLVRGSSIIGVVLLVVAIQAFYNFSNSGSVLGGHSSVTARALLDETNQQRAEDGLAPLKLNDMLSTAATLKARNMLSEQYWAHESPQGETPWHWFEEAGYTYTYAGENLAKGFSSTEDVIQAWMNSPEHRQNILDRQYQDVGFAVIPGILQGEQTMLVVALYGAPKTEAAVMNPTVLAATDTSQGPIGAFGEKLRSMPPLALASIVMLLVVSLVAALAQLYYRRLPQPVRTSWRRHHGLYKALGMVTLVVVLVTIYGGGKI